MAENLNMVDTCGFLTGMFRSCGATALGLGCFYKLSAAPNEAP